MRVIVVDDDALVTSGIKTIIEMATQNEAKPYKVVAMGRNGQEAIDLYGLHQPDILLLDIRMPVMDGIKAGQKIIATYPDAKLIYLTTFLEDEYIVEALKLGAKGYLMKTDFESIIPAIAAVASGQRVFGDEIIAKIPTYLTDGQKAKPKAIEDLTDKENELIYWLAQGLNNKEIAEKMHFSEGTIRNYLSTILEKLDLRDRTQLAIYYFKHME